MITAALEGKLDNVEYEADPVFGIMMPKECFGAPSEILNPHNTWKYKKDCDEKAKDLAEKFAENVSEEILAAEPKIS